MFDDSGGNDDDNLSVTNSYILRRKFQMQINRTILFIQSALRRFTRNDMIFEQKRKCRNSVTNTFTGHFQMNWVWKRKEIRNERNELCTTTEKSSNLYTLRRGFGRVFVRKIYCKHTNVDNVETHVVECAWTHNTALAYVDDGDGSLCIGLRSLLVYLILG